MSRLKSERVILHAGMPKAGSFALQSAAWPDTDFLALRRVALPVSDALTSRRLDAAFHIDHGNLELTLRPLWMSASEVSETPQSTVKVRGQRMWLLIECSVTLKAVGGARD